MIPKIIYYTWVSTYPLPDEYRAYIEGWKIMMPDYEFYQISMDNIEYTPFVKKFDSLLNEKFFIGCEAPYRLNMAVVGSVPGHWFTAECLKRLDNFDFNNPGPCGIEVESTVEMYTKIAYENGWVKEDKTQRVKDILVCNSKYFYPYYFNVKFTPECITEETYAIHHWAGTWTKYK
jgi:mannosyltransferase OCH1-like enzyme